MRFGNCYRFSWQRVRRHGGFVLIRRSVKSWVPHSQWSPLAIPKGAEVTTFWRGLLAVMGRRRGYLLVTSDAAYWIARIDQLWIQEYLPPKWVDDSIKRNWWCRTFPLHAVVFAGRVRSGFGEEMRTRVLIRRHWPPVEQDPKPTTKE